MTSLRSKKDGPHIPTEETRDTVSFLIMHGMSEKYVAEFLGIHPIVLKKHYEEEIDHGKNKILKKAFDGLMDLVKEKDFGAIKFVLERMGGYIAQPVINVEDALFQPVFLDRADLRKAVEHDPNSISDRQIDATPEGDFSSPSKD